MHIHHMSLPSAHLPNPIYVHQGCTIHSGQIPGIGSAHEDLAIVTPDQCQSSDRRCHPCSPPPHPQVTVTSTNRLIDDAIPAPPHPQVTARCRNHRAGDSALNIGA
jgi:hypothetical protein